ncbi:MAG TPA: glycoside hydrolase family 2 TIM barrel-domain containing protein [Bryobacteraceae bacterium]
MNRRDFLGSAIAGLAAIPGNAQAPAEGRRIFPMNRNWLYGGRNVPGASEPGFDDSRFEKVTLPHTNIVLPWHSFDDKRYEFVSIYRRHFRLPDSAKGQRAFVDFEGAMTASTVTINGHKFEEYKGGYTPFSFEITPHIHWGEENVLAVELDSTERSDIPPFGGNIDYLTFGGIYREVSLRIVPQTFIENVFAQPIDVLSAGRRLLVRSNVNGAGEDVNVELRDGDRVLQSARGPAAGVTLTGLGNVELWSLTHPKLYTVIAKLGPDEYRTRIGFREARFTPQGFHLNGQHLKLRGLNRHQTFPYVGGAMPARAQRRDAEILKKELKINLARTSHYPQSRHFLDACDELGLLVLEEIPGWQHIGENAWQDIAVRNVGEMIRRDWNHPSIILWGVRINESQDNHEFYTRTNRLAHDLDHSRQTGGIRYFYNSELLEDVFTMNDFGFPLRPPNHPLYLNTEFVGHTYSTKREDQVERVAEHTLRHARIHNQLASDDRYAGGIGWCAFDYNTHANFGSGDRICYHGVSDIFRLPKAAAGFYKSQCDPSEEIVLEPAFSWSSGDHSGAGGPGMVPVCSNCDHLKLYINGALKIEANPDRATFAHLKYPPFMVNLSDLPLNPWGDLRIDGYLGGKKVISKNYSGNGIDAQLLVESDDRELLGDGQDVTRVVLRAADEYGNTQQFSTGAVRLTIEGPAEIIGENPFGLVAGAGAIWLRTKQAAGTVTLTAKHQYLGTKQIKISVIATEPESI